MASFSCLHRKTSLAGLTSGPNVGTQLLEERRWSEGQPDAGNNAALTELTHCLEAALGLAALGAAFLPEFAVARFLCLARRWRLRASHTASRAAT